MEKEHDGYEYPIHQSLTEKILLMGVTREVAILNGTLLAAMVIGMKALWFVPFSFVIHIVFFVMTKKDPCFFEIFKRKIHKSSYYNA